MEKKTGDGQAGERLLATGAVVGALAASSCCVLPLLFVSIGISGAWISTLTSLAPYQPIFLAIAAACIAAGFWWTTRRDRAACNGSACGTPWSRRATKAALWTGLVILIAAGSVDWWAKLLS